MRLLFDLVHPAHVHLFRNLQKKVVEEGGECLAVTRDKDVTVSLCHDYGFNQEVISRASHGGLPSMVGELTLRTWRLWKIARRFKPDALLGTSASIGTVGRLIRKPSFVFNEDDANVNPLFCKLAYSTAQYIVTPECLKAENYGTKHLLYPGYQELAYLHPEHFSPRPEILEKLGLNPNKPFFILRLVSLTASHDKGKKGIDREKLSELVKILSSQGRIIISSEKELLNEFKKYQFPLSPKEFHDVLAYASLCISDSQTVTAEAAVLGVPNMRCNSFVGRLTYLKELENKHGLSKGFLPENFHCLITQTKEWLPKINEVKIEYLSRKNKMLLTAIDLSNWQYKMLKKHLIRKTIKERSCVGL